MSSGSNATWIVCACFLLSVVTTHAQLRDPEHGDELRVCADPNNMPFSNRAGEGFENALARLLAADLGKPIHYTWWPQRRGFLRNTLAAERCDVVLGVPTRSDMVLTTAPYYRSSYVFVTRRGAAPQLASFDDPWLRTARIGVHLLGDDGASVPPVQALTARGMSEQIHGYSIYGAYSHPDPPRALIDAVAEDEIDVAVAWGPLAGFAARAAPVMMDVVPVPDEPGLPPMAYDISLGVRRGEAVLAAQFDAVLKNRASEIRALLERYGVPMLALPRRAEQGG